MEVAGQKKESISKWIFLPHRNKQDLVIGVISKINCNLWVFPLLKETLCFLCKCLGQFFFSFTWKTIMCHMTRLKWLCMGARADCPFRQRAAGNLESTMTGVYKSRKKGLWNIMFYFFQIVNWNYNYLSPHRISPAAFFETYKKIMKRVEKQ